MGGGRRKRRRKESIGRKEREKRKKKEGKKRGEAEREKITDREEKEKEKLVQEEERETNRGETRRYDTKRRSPCSRTRTVDENARWGRPRRNREQEQDENGGRVGEVEARARGAADREGEEAAVG